MQDQVTIVDYSLEERHLFAQVSIEAGQGEQNFHNVSFDAWAVIEAAVALGIIYYPHDSDNGRRGQKISIGYYHPAFIGQQGECGDRMVYHTYGQIESEFSGEDRERIVKHLALANLSITESLTLQTL